jgi:hypothetical protein
MAINETIGIGLATGVLLIGQTIPDVPIVGDPKVQWTATAALMLIVGWLLCKTIPAFMAEAKEERELHLTRMREQQAAYQGVVKEISDRHERAINVAHQDHEALQKTLHEIATESSTTTREMVQHCAETIGTRNQVKS